ncbi:MAG TPA: hypothetical protein VEO54_11700 [Thermoanaerobaculia bacterium]|nr:hypothetical protein [Thermoanaerobaculia bacterium]
MSRFLLLGFVLLASLGASAAIPIAPLEPRIAPNFSGAVDPAAATNGTTTLVAWTVPHHYPAGQRVQARLLGVHDAAVYLDHAARPQVGWNGHEYLVAHSHGAAVVHGNGALGARARLQFWTVNAVAWNGSAWVVGFVREDQGLVMLLDRELNAVRTIELGAARSVRLTTIDGNVWAVHQREADTEVFPVDDGEPRFRLGGHARMIGPMAILEETLRLSFLDPRSGFSEPRPFMASFEIPLELVHAAPFGSGALFAIYSPVGKTLLLVTIDAQGHMQEYTAVLTGAATAPRVAVAGTTLFLGNGRQIYQFPLQPWPREPFALTDAALVSLDNFAYRSEPSIVALDTHALVFWKELTENTYTEGSFMRAVDADGVPFGPVTRLPFTYTYDRKAVAHGDRFLFTWRDNGTLYAWTGGGAPVELGRGGSYDVAYGPHGAFAVWHNHDRGISGTPLHADGSPVVPGGFVISSAVSEFGARIDVVPQGFLVHGTREGTFISPAGTPLLSFPIGPEGGPLAGGELLAWRNGTLLASAGGEHYVPQWAGAWTPFAIHPMEGGRHLVILHGERTLATSIVTVAGDRVVSDTEPRLLLDQLVDGSSITVIGGKPLVVYGYGQIWVATYPARRRAAR